MWLPPTSLILLLLLLHFARAQVQYDVCPDADDVFINCGGSNLATGIRCDTGEYVTGTTDVFTTTRPMDEKGSCIKQYETHRWALPGSGIEYKIPVPPGKYMVYLMFMETWELATNGTRLFTVALNGKPVRVNGMDGAMDVFSMAGRDNPVFVNTEAETVDNAITVTLGRIPGKNNPFICGIGIRGLGANKLVGNTGLNDCVKGTPIPTAVSPSPRPKRSNFNFMPSPLPGFTNFISPLPDISTIRITLFDDGPSTSEAPPVPPSPSAVPIKPPSRAPPAALSSAPSTAPSSAPSAAPSTVPSASADPCANSKVTTDFKDQFHVAHAVAGGPYAETDFLKQGKKAVKLDGLGSHSHETNPSFGEIKTYKWTWKNGSATGPTPAPEFPLGVTELTLEVTDQFCNKAKESTTVTVNPSTSPGAYCYYYDLLESESVTVPLPVAVTDNPKPMFAQTVGDINFGSTASFGKFKFNTNSFAVRCVYSIEVKTPGIASYKIVHNGPIKVYNDGQLLASSKSVEEGTTTSTKPKTFKAGFHKWQILYMRPQSLPGQLKLLFNNGAVVPPDVVRHDSSAKLPVISSSTKLNGFEGEFITIKGSAFVNGVTVKFGDQVAEPVESNEGSIQVRIPKKKGTMVVVDIIVYTDAGVSNGVTFMYGKIVEPCQTISLKEDTLKTTTGGTFSIKDIAVLNYGPDGRLYLGSQKNMIYAIRVNQDLVVVGDICSKDISGGGPRRWVLGIAFNPKSSALRMYFSSSTAFWKKNGLIKDFTKGWNNGKVQSVTLNGPMACFNERITDVVTGLPVSNHDHAVNALNFLPDGRLIIHVGGATNGGISVPTDNLGGIPPSYFAGALVTCPLSGARITYRNLSDPTSAATGDGCEIYASGFRNSLSGTVHTNGEYYLTSNGPNQGFGEFSTNCRGGQAPAKNLPDRLYKVDEGECHGHPNLVRGATEPEECVIDGPGCVLPLLSNLKPSTNGILEYRSNVFGRRLKGNLFLTRFSDTANKKGQIARVILDGDGNVATNGFTNLFRGDSGLNIVEGPRGEMIMPRVFKTSFYVLKPLCGKVTTTYLIGVHPKRGPAAGGHRVMITGFNFGSRPRAMFGPEPCTHIRVIDDEAFTCVTPPSVENTQVKVVVNGTFGENIPTEGADYWYW